ncbi:MAG: alpha/beta hydrolase [Microthrixaceae bacterium]
MTSRALPLVAALAVLAGCGGGSADDESQPPETVTAAPAEESGFPAGWQPEALQWSTCDGSGADPASRAQECAALAVPLDWSDPDGETIELALARIRATGDRSGSLLVNPGGPGASGIDYLGPFAGETTLGTDFDLVSWDPRGVGRSTSVDCDAHVRELYAADPSPDDAQETEALETAAAEVAADCAEAAPELLEHLHTDEVARDLEGIRLALGAEKLNYLGFSYGTHIGQAYAEMFGDRIRAMVLDGVVDPSQGFEEFLLGQVEAFDTSFAEQTRRCSQAGAAACGVEDLEASYDRVVAALEEQPLSAGSSGEVGPAEVATAATYTAYLPDGWTLLGPALAAAEDGRGDSLAQLASSYVSIGSYGPYAGVVCTDSAPPAGQEQYRGFAARATEVSARFGPTVANEMLPCATWAAPAQDEPVALTAPDAPPILVVGNTGDPATPLLNAEAVADSLDSGVLVVADMDGHTAYGANRCVTEIVDDYFTELALPEQDTRC